MTLDIAPFIMSENEKSYSLLLVDLNQNAETFRDCGYEEINGYVWHGVADSLIHLRVPDLKNKVNFDCESSMFVAYGTDKNALEELALLLQSAMHDADLLKSAIQNADPDLMD